MHYPSDRHRKNKKIILTNAQDINRCCIFARLNSIKSNEKILVRTVHRSGVQFVFAKRGSYILSFQEAPRVRGSPLFILPMFQSQHAYHRHPNLYGGKGVQGTALISYTWYTRYQHPCWCRQRLQRYRCKDSGLS